MSAASHIAHAIAIRNHVTIPVYQKTVWIMEATSQTPRRYTREPGLRVFQGQVLPLAAKDLVFRANGSLRQ
jgi:hypothetical protein